MFYCCKQSNEISSNQFEKEDLTEIEEIEKQIQDRRTKWENYENMQIEYVGLTNPDSAIIRKNDLLFHFKTIGEYSKYFEIIEVYDKFHSSETKCKMVRYEIDRNCHPDIGQTEFSKKCINIIESKEYKIEQMVFDSLYKYLVKKEFWDLKESQSEYLTHDIVRYYHGKVLDYSAYYALRFPTKTEIDTFVKKKHRVARAPIDSEIMTQINLAVENILLNKMPDDNRR